MCMDIITHWFYTIKPSGWIPREQMRGKEAESNLEWELAESIKEGNPPSFMFVMKYLLEKGIKNKDQRVTEVFTNL